MQNCCALIILLVCLQPAYPGTAAPAMPTPQMPPPAMPPPVMPPAPAAGGDPAVGNLIDFDIPQSTPQSQQGAAPGGLQDQLANLSKSEYSSMFYKNCNE